MDHDVEWGGYSESQDESGESSEVQDDRGDEMAML